MYDDILDMELWAGHVLRSVVHPKTKNSPLTIHLFVDGHEGKVTVCGYQGPIDLESLTRGNEYAEDRYCGHCKRRLKLLRKVQGILFEFKAEGTIHTLPPDIFNAIYGSPGAQSAQRYEQAQRALATLKDILGTD